MKRFLISALVCLMALGANAQTPKGHLLIIGGGKCTPQLLDKFIDNSGGKDAKYLVITCAGHRREGRVTCQKDGEKFIALMNGQGVNDIHWIDPTREDCDNAAYVATELKGVTGVFFTGGIQTSIINAMRGTLMHEKLMSMYVNDGICIGGTSAGAAMMPDPMLETSSPKKVNGKAPEDKTVRDIRPSMGKIGPGMGFLKNVIIDQHFIKRARHNRMLSTAMDCPGVTTFGIDESTAMFVSNGCDVTVVGESSVTVVEVEASAIKQDKNGNYGCSGMTVRMLLDGDTYTIKDK